MDLLISTWIPRSYLHLREAHSKLSELKFSTKKVSFNKNLTFLIENIHKDHNATFTLTPTGIYSLHLSIPKKDLTTKLITTLEDIMLEHIIKTWHSVTYKQIKHGIIPLSFSTIIFSEPGDLSIPNNVISYLGKQYRKNYEPIYHTFQFTLLLKNSIDKYVLTMSDHYHKADKVVNRLRGDFELSELKKTVFKMDFIEKNTGETISRLADAQDCLARTQKDWKGYSKKISTASKLNIPSLLEQNAVDLAYTQRLWDQLDGFLDNLDNASGARLSFQETVESRRIEWFLSIEVASVIATLLASIFISEFTGINALILSITALGVWVVVYQLMSRFRAK